MMEPLYLFADEPTGNLDSANAESIYELIRKLSREFGVTFLVATHQEIFAKSADRCIQMKDGLLVA